MTTRAHAGSPRSSPPLRRAVALAALAFAGAARPQTPPAPSAPAAPLATTYALSAQVRLSPEMLAMRYEHDPRFAGMPPNPAVSVDVGVQTRDAYAALARRLFRAEPGLERVELEVSVASAELDPRGGWWHARVRHDVVLRSTTGDEVARWRVEGEGRLPGFGGSAVPLAFAAAAETAAHRLGRELDASPAVRAFLAQRGLAPRAVETRPAAPRPVVPERGRLLAFLDAGMTASTGTVERSTGLALRGGVSGRWLLAQLTLDGHRGAFAAAPTFGFPDGDASLQAVAVGLDVGGVARVRRRVELRAGVGAQWLRGRAEQKYVIQAPGGEYVSSRISMAASGTAASLFAGVAYAPAGRRIPRFAVELRRVLQQPLRFEALQRELAPARTSLTFVIGIERILWAGP